MDKFDRILIPTDGSADANYAAKKGLSLAKKIHAKEVIALYVKDLSYLYNTPEDDTIFLINSGLTEEGKKILAEVKQAGQEIGVDVETLIVEGHPADEILNIAEDRNIDIIVMGTLGRSGISRLLMGSVAEKVTRHANCSVFIHPYRPEEVEDEEGGEQASGEEEEEEEEEEQ